MKRVKNKMIRIALLTWSASSLIANGFAQTNQLLPRFPYRQAGLSSQQAAVHLLDRFSYGATPGQVKLVADQGLEQWFLSQLAAKIPDDSLNVLLCGLDAIELSNQQVVKIFPAAGQIKRQAIKGEAITSDSAGAAGKKIRAYMDSLGLRPQSALFRQLIAQKIYRASYSENQLLEVMTSFWFNHFNVSVSKNQCSLFIPAYEREVIRPGALGHFGDLLLATAKSPAMLFYLDNFSSSAQGPAGMKVGWHDPNSKKRAIGVNENYAREVMELHTLGVDGGYCQSDVTNAARIFTGWTVSPFVRQARSAPKHDFKKNQMRNGDVSQGDFLFNATRHDREKKTVLGVDFGPDGGYQEGVRLLHMLAHHRATAQFICSKLATRFVSDSPSKALIEKMALVFQQQDGDIKAVLIALVTSPEFWSPAALRQKIKSPFELAIGAVRNLGAKIEEPHPLYEQISKMGEKLYAYQAPSGFPDRALYWVNTGSLLNRMNFGLALASGKVRGVRLDLAALNAYHEPESTHTALNTYIALMMPGGPPEQVSQCLTPLLNDPELTLKVGHLAATHTAQTERNGKGQPSQQASFGPKATAGTGLQDLLARVVGLIIGSPEYQRR